MHTRATDRRTKGTRQAPASSVAPFRHNPLTRVGAHGCVRKCVHTYAGRKKSGLAPTSGGDGLRRLLGLLDGRGLRLHVDLGDGCGLRGLHGGGGLRRRHCGVRPWRRHSGGGLLRLR